MNFLSIGVGRGRGRLGGHAGWIVFFVVVFVLVLPAAWGRPVAAQSKAPHATELRGVLTGAADYHFFGLETIQPDQAVALSLRFEAADLSAPEEEVNFVVLSEAGLVRFLAGADPREVALAAGSPLLFDPQGNRRTALVPGVADTGFTVIVFGTAKTPVRYALQVQGGLLRDDAGQSQSSVMVDDAAPSPSGAVQPVEIVKQAGGMPVPARRVSGALDAFPARHYLRLVPDDANGEVSFTLQYISPSLAQRGKLNVWVLTQDGVRQLEQGGLIEELNLAGGVPAMALAGATMMRTTLRVAERVPYVVVIDNQLDRAATYTLVVDGAVVVDELGQTNEAQAAAIEALVLGR